MTPNDEDVPEADRIEQGQEVEGHDPPPPPSIPDDVPEADALEQGAALPLDDER